MSDDSWLEGAPQKPKRGELFSQNRLRQILGFSPPTFSGLIKEGAPVVSRGGRTQSWEMNSADFFDWYVDRAVAKATNNLGDAYDVAKARDKEAQARMRELQVAAREREIIPIDDVLSFNNRVAGEVRARALALESQIHGLTEDQREQLQDAVRDMLSSISGLTLDEWNDVEFGDQESEGCLEETPRQSPGISTAAEDGVTGMG